MNNSDDSIITRIGFYDYNFFESVMSRTLCSLEIDGREADSLHETAYIDKAS